jgi:hypothetical protein
VKKQIWIVMIVLAMVFISACGGNDNGDTTQEEIEEPKILEVQFDLPETADVNESIELKATVTYGDELVEDADEVIFEHWEQGNEDDSTMLEADNNGDGTYTAEVMFEDDGVYEIYAHTTARDMHTMPKKSVAIGDAESQEADDEHHDDESHDHGEHAEGFDMHFVNPEDVQAGQETDLTVHLQLDDEMLEGARVRYEITSDDDPDMHEWVDADEFESGVYSAVYAFEENGAYDIMIHVENDDGLHEHEEHQVEVK